jgi:DNA-3-methyladenine glycosylase I
MQNAAELARCPWCGTDPLYTAYHDLEWGTPLHDNQKLFELLCLEGAQAGLSWITVLRKREAYRQAFDQFDPVKITGYGEAKIAELMANAGIVRNRLKINAVIQNAKAYLTIHAQSGGFDQYLWSFVAGAPIQNAWGAMGGVPASTPISEAMSRDLKKRGFKFVGPTICYAYMQSAGLVNDHLTNCYRYQQVSLLR